MKGVMKIRRFVACSVTSHTPLREGVLLGLYAIFFYFWVEKLSNLPGISDMLPK